MSITLYLVRHAKAETPTRGLKDFDRMLAPKGHNQAPQMGGKLKQLGCKPDAIISSPAERAAQTARYLAEQINYEPENIIFNDDVYSSSVRILLGIINKQPQHLKQLMLVGHNPEFSFLAEHLTGQSIGNLPTCGMVKITFEADNWNQIAGGLGNLVWFEHPKAD